MSDATKYAYGGGAAGSARCKAMSKNEKEQTLQYGLTLGQKLLYVLVVFVLSVIIALGGPMLSGVMGWVAFILLGVLLGIVTFYVSAGWTYKIAFEQGQIRIWDRAREIIVPNDRIGMLVRNGGFPFPTLWLVLRGAKVGQPIPEKGVDPRTRELIERYQERHPGKSLTIVPVPGGYLRSVSGFASELRRRIPPVTIDERLGGN